MLLQYLRDIMQYRPYYICMEIVNFLGLIDGFCGGTAVRHPGGDILRSSPKPQEHSTITTILTLRYKLCALFDAGMLCLVSSSIPIVS
jgi:hypothetical protein